MRLIDADKLIKDYTQIFVEAYGIKCAEMFQGVINQTNTAYDVDKVVEDLLLCTACSGHKDHEKQCGGCAGCLECKLEDAYYKAIEIIKRGGKK